MQITLVQGLLIALLVFICAFDKHMETFMWFRPLVVAFFTGIILGDVRLGMQAGAVAELSYLGLLTVGGTVPPDPLFAGLMTTVLAYTTGCDVNTALGLAVPFALIGQWINTGTNTFYAGFLPKVDKCAAAGDEKGIAKVMYTGWILYAAMFALAAFLSTYALQSGISAFVAAFPEWLVHGFEVAGGLMPAVGLARRGIDDKNMLHRGSPPHQHIRISLNLFRKHTGNCIMFLQKKVNKLKIKSYAGDLLRQGGKDVPLTAQIFR